MNEPTTAGEDILVARGLCKTYTLGATRLEVLKGIDLDVRRGEVLGVVGASGAGKSTLLHLLGGLDMPTTGSVKLDDADLAGLSAAQLARVRSRKVGFVFQAYHLLPELDALENVTVPARLASGRVTRQEWEERGSGLLKAVGLADRAHHRPAELSGGEQQRVAIARALVNRPALVLADEPTGNLDSKTGEMIIELLLQLRVTEQATLVMVTHDATIAKHCMRTLHMTDGRLNEA